MKRRGAFAGAPFSGGTMGDSIKRVATLAMLGFSVLALLAVVVVR